MSAHVHTVERTACDSLFPNVLEVGNLYLILTAAGSWEPLSTE